MTSVALSISAFGTSLKAKLSNAVIDGAPEDQLRAPLEKLFSELAVLCGLPADAVGLIGETTLNDLKSRPDYAVTVHGALVASSRSRRRRKARTRVGSAMRTTRSSGAG